jgi:hypothetical protein
MKPPSGKIRIGQLRLSVPRTRALNSIPAAQNLAKSVAAALTAVLADAPAASPRVVPKLWVRVPGARSGAPDIARAIRKSLERG